eukprot:745185_1
MNVHSKAIYFIDHFDIMSRIPGVPAPSHVLWKTTQAQLCGPAHPLKPRRDRGNKTTPSQTPAPNRYTPRRLSKSYSYSMGIRLKSESELKDACVPGPTKYNSTKSYKALYDKSPSWSMQSRTLLQSQTKANLKKPGPTKYYPKPNPKLRRSPSYSFRPRLQRGSPLDALGCKDNPGPSAYYLPSTLSTHRYSITMKSRTYKLNKQQLSNPAPNHYNPKRGSRPHSARTCTMSFRINSKSKKHASPGPIYNVTKPM